MYKVQHQPIWPANTFNSIPIKTLLQQKNLELTRFIFPQLALEYILHICETKQFKVTTFELALSLSSRYLIKRKGDMQLVLLVTLFIASKTNQHKHLLLAELHQYSNHSYTNNDVYQCESAILQELKFSIFSQGRPDLYIKTLLKMISQLMPEQSYAKLVDLCEDVQKCLWCCIYRGEVHGIRKVPLKYIAVTVINIALMLATKCTGRFPHSIWMCKVVDMTEDRLMNLTENLLKVIIGKETFQKLVI